ncbi:MAG: nuclear transport factor 2 family protein [Erysipelotrichaceae bacterium]|nr:nuclear transport factor 2 family protein [Erysipelotrichaceae bacterium]
MNNNVKEKITNVIYQYANSIDHADNIEWAKKIWFTNDNVSMIHPKGHEIGWKSIEKNFYKNTMTDKFTKRKLNVYDINIYEIDSLVYAELYWEFEAIKVDGTPHNTKGRETQIFSKDEDGIWKIVHIHYSSFPLE